MAMTKSRFDDMSPDDLNDEIKRLKAQGQKVDARELLRANQAAARMISTGKVDGQKFVTEAYQDWERIRKHFPRSAGHLPGSNMDSPGRDKDGNIRDFDRMPTRELMRTLRALNVHGEDHEAHKAAGTAAAKKLGVTFMHGRILIPKHVALDEAEILQEFWSDVARMRSSQVRAERRQLKSTMSDTQGMRSPGAVSGDVPTPGIPSARLAIGTRLSRTIGSKTKAFSMPTPEGPITATHTGADTFHVAGGGFHTDPEMRRGDRMVVGAGAARQEMAERVHATYAADRAHTSMIAQRVRDNGHAGVTPVNKGHGIRGASIKQTGDQFEVHHPDLAGHKYDTAEDAVNAAKQTIRKSGGRFLRSGEDIDPLHTGVPQHVGAVQHFTHPRREAMYEQFERNFGDTDAPRNLIRDQLIDKSRERLGLTSGEPADLHQHVANLAHSHAQLLQPHIDALTSVMSHPAFHHVATHVMSARHDTAERDLQEAIDSRDGRSIIAARARLNALTETPMVPGAESPSTAERKAFTDVHGKDAGVSLKKDKDGFFVHTHRARSKSFPLPAAIPKTAVEFIASTG